MRISLIIAGAVLLVAAAGALGYFVAGYRVADGERIVAQADAEPPRVQGVHNQDEKSPAPESLPQNAITRQAHAWGITSCSQRLALMSEFLTANTTYASNSMRGAEDANRQLFSATIASKNRTSGQESVSSLSVAPVAGETCNVVYDQVSYFPQACAAVREKNFPGFAAKVAFGDVAEAHSTKDGRNFLYMLRAGDGCLTIKKQVLY